MIRDLLMKKWVFVIVCQAFWWCNRTLVLRQSTMLEPSGGDGRWSLSSFVRSPVRSYGGDGKPLRLGDVVSNFHFAQGAFYNLGDVLCTPLI
jgi:hypothetical protein